jgi:dynein heavy chain 1
MTLKPIVHELQIENQVIFLDPPIEYARATWIRQLHDWLGVLIRHFSCLFVLQAYFQSGVVCQLRLIQSSRHEIGLQTQGGSVTETTYASLVRC